MLFCPNKFLLKGFVNLIQILSVHLCFIWWTSSKLSSICHKFCIHIWRHLWITHDDLREQTSTAAGKNDLHHHYIHMLDHDLSHQLMIDKFLRKVCSRHKNNSHPLAGEDLSLKINGRDLTIWKSVLELMIFHSIWMKLKLASLFLQK